MRAVRVTGGPETLAVADVAVPEPGPGEVLVEVHAVGVNQLERQVMAGARLGGEPAALPRTVGIDPVGVVVAAGGGPADELLGRRVAVKPNLPCGDCRFCREGREADCTDQTVLGVHRDGGAAEYAAVPARAVFPLPDGVPFPVAAAAVHSVPIALHMIRRGGGVRPGDAVLVTGATGALGCAALQVATALGARVIAGALEGEPTGELRDLGADAVLTYGVREVAGLPGAVRAHVPDGVRLLIDATGSGPLIEAALDALGWAGHAVFAAALPGAAVTVESRPFYARRLTLHGCAAADNADMRDGLALLAGGRVSPPVTAVHGLEQAGAAYAHAGRRDHLGKVVLRVRPEPGARPEKER
ncbi:alcohol dehydrogenase catalytic domain-containing protein [Actinomadura violacea]|uniref:Alcohol dehydrogenase catalytic domain-containing protein n=1 Tax=Actinomadura violacea TaxID=2819934 RepID=A0ABS3S7C2_9ACTN|nr:alcohol dehydrogenase catalytic domain-containing protein [Actinomadura violacea]MBO2464908.1 alcohol dehydrogenase catalytic domain-containing protein [Actinomadura violacea]